MCVTIEEATVDGNVCVGDEAGAENDSSMLVDEEERGLKNTVFGAWRNVMWRMVCCMDQSSSRGSSRRPLKSYIWLISRRAEKFAGISLPSFRCVADMEV
jgi:hypothetical protein